MKTRFIITCCLFVGIVSWTTHAAVVTGDYARTGKAANIACRSPDTPSSGDYLNVYMPGTAEQTYWTLERVQPGSTYANAALLSFNFDLETGSTITDVTSADLSLACTEYGGTWKANDTFDARVYLVDGDYGAEATWTSVVTGGAYSSTTYVNQTITNPGWQNRIEIDVKPLLESIEGNLLNKDTDDFKILVYSKESVSALNGFYDSWYAPKLTVNMGVAEAVPEPTSLSCILFGLLFSIRMVSRLRNK